MTTPATPDELREFIADLKLLNLAARKLLPERLHREILLRAVTPYGKPLRRCSDEEIDAIENAMAWKDLKGNRNRIMINDKIPKR